MLFAKPKIEFVRSSSGVRPANGFEALKSQIEVLMHARLCLCTLDHVKRDLHKNTCISSNLVDMKVWC